MAEYFDISLIVKKTNTSKSELDVCLNQFVYEGKNSSALFVNKEIIVSHFEDEESDFDEISIGIPNQQFSKENFENELLELTDFVNSCFECNSNLKYALCSYELNGYLISRIKKIQDFNNDEFLKKFPIIYKQIDLLERPKLELNIGAQKMW